MKRVGKAIGAMLLLLLIDALLTMKTPSFSMEKEWNDEFFAVAETSACEKPPDAAEIIARIYDGGTDVGFGIKIINESNVQINAQALLKKKLHLPVSEAPSVLILHTHTSESYNDENESYFTKDPHSHDTSQNVVHIGQILTRELERAGIGVLHAEQCHDNDFNQSYERSKETMQLFLQKYPTISVVLDIHRDTLIDSSGTKYSATTTIDGIKTAQVMLLVGVGNKTYPHPAYEENLSLAFQLQSYANAHYPTLMRPILIRPSRYNQHLSTGALLAEIGSCGNTPDQAEHAAELFAEVLIATLRQN